MFDRRGVLGTTARGAPCRGRRSPTTRKVTAGCRRNQQTFGMIFMRTVRRGLLVVGGGGAGALAAGAGFSYSASRVRLDHPRGQGLSGQHLGEGPYKGKNKPEPQKEANLAHAKLRALGERANAQLKT